MADYSKEMTRYKHSGLWQTTEKRRQGINILDYGRLQKRDDKV